MTLSTDSGTVAMFGRVPDLQMTEANGCQRMPDSWIFAERGIRCVAQDDITHFIGILSPSGLTCRVWREKPEDAILIVTNLILSFGTA
jgi:hypothetical protein